MGPRNALRAVLFDWDGTLLDSYHADAQAYLAMFHKMGVHWGLEDLTRHYSPDWYRVYRAAQLPRARWEEADRLWMRYYRQHRLELQPDARRVLEQIVRRYSLALVTSGSRSRVRRQLREFGLMRLFAARVCSEDAPRRKPDPAPVLLALRRLRVAPEACVYVGDAPDDVEMAHRAGVWAIAVLGASPVPERLRASGPDAVIASIRALPRLLKKY